jgi:dihydrofolate reductase
MSRLIVSCFSISLDGYGAGPSQSIDNPLGVGGEDLHEWIVDTEGFNAEHHKEGGRQGVDSGMAAKGSDNIGAWILGRNMFGPVRGPWPDESWKGWWGPNPPFHVPTFVLTNHAREPVEMQGGTTFHFVTGGIETALERAQTLAGGKNIRLGGGATTLQQYLRAALVDEMHLAIAPILLGRGESLLGGVDLKNLGYSCLQRIEGEKATHYIIVRDV